MKLSVVAKKRGQFHHYSPQIANSFLSLEMQAVCIDILHVERNQYA